MIVFVILGTLFSMTVGFTLGYVWRHYLPPHRTFSEAWNQEFRDGEREKMRREREEEPKVIFTDPESFTYEPNRCPIADCKDKFPHDHIYYVKEGMRGWKTQTKCPVEGCQIKENHSHTEALLKRIRGN